MVVLHHMKTIGGIPNGSLSSSILAQAITEANKEVQKATVGMASSAYNKYISTLHAEVVSIPVSMLHDKCFNFVSVLKRKKLNNALCCCWLHPY